MARDYHSSLHDERGTSQDNQGPGSRRKVCKDMQALQGKDRAMEQADEIGSNTHAEPSSVHIAAASAVQVVAV